MVWVCPFFSSPLSLSAFPFQSVLLMMDWMRKQENMKYTCWTRPMNNGKSVSFPLCLSLLWFFSHSFPLFFSFSFSTAKNTVSRVELENLTIRETMVASDAFIPSSSPSVFLCLPSFLSFLVLLFACMPICLSRVELEDLTIRETMAQLVAVSEAYIQIYQRQQSWWWCLWWWWW